MALTCLQGTAGCFKKGSNINQTSSPSCSKTAPLPEGGYKVEGQYIWDGWLMDAVENGKPVLFRYALSANANLKPSERHDVAAVRFASSRDAGRSWKDEGLIFSPRTDGVWPNQAVWTSNTMIIDGTWYLWMTGRSREDYVPGKPRQGMGTLQKIGRATSKDGRTWSQPEVLLDGTTSEALQLGYDVTEDDKVFTAFRDPMVFKDPDFSTNNKLHMVFATKERVTFSDGERKAIAVLPTVGHAISTDKTGDFKKWELQRPLRLPHYNALNDYDLSRLQSPAKIRQVEVPYVVNRVDRNGKTHTYLFISTQHNPEEPTNDLKQAAFRGYVSANGLTGPFEPLYKNDETRPFPTEPDKIYGSELYAATVSEHAVPGGKTEYFSATFFSEQTKWPLTGTPMYPIVWNETVTPAAPHFKFPKGADILVDACAVEKK